MNKSNYPEFVIALPEGHPVKVYFEENCYVLNLLDDILVTDPEKDFQKFFNLFNELCAIDKHYTRKENQLFPYLEKYGWNGPSQGMWSFHDSNRDLLKGMRKKIENKNIEDLSYDIQVINAELRRLMHVEEFRLFPHAVELLKTEDWMEMKNGDEEIGWMLKEKPVQWPSEEKKENDKSPFEGFFKMEEGIMNLEQINLLLQVIPVDLTYVDENDRVIFYNRGEKRVFPRSAGVIGREVRFCHPPKSVSTVLRILEEFRKGTKDEAEFWIQYRSKVVHIRYFAVRGKEKEYKGVIEMSQDITDIQKIQGERRLLNWDN